jgi:hypothetical protein
MKITADTMLFVVGNSGSGVNHLTLTGLVDAVKGGLKVDETTVFTDLEEADEHNKRMNFLNKGTYLLSGLDTDKLERLVKRIESDEIDDLLDKVMG